METDKVLKDRAYRKKWRENNRDRQRKMTDDWEKNHPEKTNQYSSAFKKRNPSKNRAHSLVYFGVKTGKLIKTPCSVCGEERVQAHHDDYEKPYEVLWVCGAHHREIHKRKEAK